MKEKPISTFRVHKPGRSIDGVRKDKVCTLSDVFQPEQETIRVPFNRIISEQLNDVYYYYLCILHSDTTIVLLCTMMLISICCI